MAKVAGNQERAEAQRLSVVYHQTVLARMHRGRNKLCREEYYEFQVLPTETGVEKERLVFRGKYEDEGKLHDYDEPHYEYKDLDVDGDIISDLVDSWTHDEDSKDGVDREQFPLTRDRQRQFEFKLAGQEKYNGRPVWKIVFTPKKGQEWDAFFSGEALIDVAEYQPVLVTTNQAKGIPLAVRVLLGTNIRQTGFKVTYQNFGEGLWFPVTYGGEFEVRVLFGYQRKISLSMKNRDVRRAKADSSIRYESTNP